jgi:hypothetical protein
MVKIARNSAEFRYEFSEGFTDQRPVLAQLPQPKHNIDIF